jgi:DNA replication and repair protein RecF
MYLENLKIKNFRNYRDQDLDFDKNTIVVTGDNGNGKTNLLESIYYISAGKSHRTNKSEELINCADDFTIIRATVSERKEKPDSDNGKKEKHLIEIELSRNDSIKIRIDRVPYRKKSAFISILPSVIFSPDDLRIMKGSPANRRSFLDGVIEKIQKDYQDLCNRYQKILNQRNSLLKSMGDINHTAGKSTLETWDENLVKYGSEMILQRLCLISEMKDIFTELMSKFFPGSKTEIFYTFS